MLTPTDSGEISIEIARKNPKKPLKATTNGRFFYA